MAEFNHTGSGGLELSGTADHSKTKVHVADSGIVFGGSATVTSSGLLNKNYTGSGGLLLSGSAAAVFFPSGGILPNQDWSIAPDSEEDDAFLYKRLTNQVNPLACRESGPTAIGDITEGLNYKEWTLIYSYTTGKFFLNDVEEFTSLGAVKVDFTFDVWGYPTFVWATSDGELKLRYRDPDSQAYSTVTLEQEDCSDAFICLAEKRLAGLAEYNKIYLAYYKGIKVLVRKYLEQEYGLPREISLVANNEDVPRIVGMGVTPSYKLQLRTRYSYAGRIE